MKAKSTLSVLCTVIVSVLFSQEIAAQKKFIANPVTNESAVSLRSHFSKYLLFNINTAEISGYAREQKGNKASFELQLPGFANWKFSVSEHDILSKDYTLVVNSPSGKSILPKPACMTYAGYLSDVANSRVRLTIDNDAIYGIIKNGDQEYFIEPLRYLNKQGAPDVFVVYNAKDVSADPNLTCGVKETEQRSNSLQRLTAGTNCVQTQLAIASDESMYLRYGSAAAVQTHNIGVMNNVIWDYVNAQFNDNIEFVIVTQNVSTSSATDQLSPAYTGTNSNTILPNFRTWGQAGNFGVTYDLAQFWTTRNIDTDGAGGGSGTVGLAYVGAVCGSFRYHILEDFTGSNPSGSGYQLRVLTTHEIGHNFNCGHDGAGSGFVMAPSVNNTSAWSAASIASVDAYVPGLGCLSSCSAAGVPLANFIGSPEAICTGGTLQLTDHSLQGPTSWSWSMSSGSPSTSTDRNPAVSYGSSGVKTVTLTSTNGGGSSTPYSKNILVSSSPAAACSNTGAVATDAGIKSFSLNNINKVTGGTSTDGDKYMNFSCSDVTSLLANTSYNVSVNVGTTVPSNQFNLVQLFIDYNNDGDFADANEAVYSSPSCYIGTHTFSFSTIASPPVTNQFLRLRVIAKDCVGGVNSCYNVTNGQVEDYSVYFASGILLPVNLLSFDGYHHNGNNILNWQTSGEKDNDHFEIERSTDGISFESIGNVNGVLNSSAASRYSFTDDLRNGFSGYNRLYYRLKIVAISGQAEYSKVVTIINKPGKNELLLSLQPNPFTNSITASVQLKAANNLSMQLMDVSGRVIYRDERRLPEGIHTITYNNFEGLAKGIYLVKLTCNNETVSRLVKKQ